MNADASARDLRFEGQSYGNINAKASTTGQTVSYNLIRTSPDRISKIAGNTQLTAEYPTTADANLRDLPVEKSLLVFARRTDIPARGSLCGTAHFTGTMQTPHGSVDLDLANAVLYDEPIDHVRAKLSYLTQRVDVPAFEIVSGPSRIELVGRYDHAGRLAERG